MRRDDDRPSTPLPYEDQSKMKKTSTETTRSSIREVISGARATISQPSRPFTPRETMQNRKLFYDQEYTDRPSSAISITSSNFKVLAPIRPPSQEERQSDEPETIEQSEKRKFWAGINALLQVMDPDNDSDAIKEAADSVFLLLTTHQNQLSENQQRVILQRVSKLMDNKEPLILFKATAIILQLSPDGPFLLSTCKLLFQLSKQSECDKHFREEKVLDPLIRLLRNPKQEKSWDTWLFAIAALKNISTDSTEIQKLLLKQHIISVLSNVIQMVNQKLPGNDDEEINQQAQLLVQVTSLLRNLSVLGSKCVKHFIRYQILEIMYQAMDSLNSHAEFIHNCCRILSKISIHAECRQIMIKKPYIACFLKILEHHKHNKPIVIRAAFVLGNLTFADDRESISSELSKQMGILDKGVPFLLDLLEMYINHEQKKADQRLIKETEDLLTKLIRLIANIALHEKQGSFIVTSPKAAKLIGLMEKKPIVKCEELVLNIVRCITNLSYYALTGSVEESPLFQDQVKLAQLLAPLLLYDHPDAVLESSRAFGNLSRSPDVRAWMHETRVDEVMLILIDHSRIDIVRSICGVLINLANDANARHSEMFASGSIIDRLMDVLDRADVHLVTLILQILHNLTLVDNLYKKEQIQQLRDTIIEMSHHLQDEVEAEEQDRDPSYELEAIERLQKVATNLLHQLDVINR